MKTNQPMPAVSNQFKSPTTKKYDQALWELSDKGPMDSIEYQEHQAYIVTLLAQIEQEVNDVELRANILKEVKHLNTLPAKYEARWGQRSYFADSIDYLVGIVFDSHRSTCRAEAIKQDN